jgi:hypothetical protein
VDDRAGRDGAYLPAGRWDSGTIPARWTDLPGRVEAEPGLGVLASPAGWRLLLGRGERLRGVVRAGVEPRGKTEARMSGQLALATSEQMLVPAAVWETLPPERQLEVTLRLARLLARLVEAERDE